MKRHFEELVALTHFQTGDMHARLSDDGKTITVHDGRGSETDSIDVEKTMQAPAEGDGRWRRDLVLLMTHTRLSRHTSRTFDIIERGTGSYRKLIVIRGVPQVHMGGAEDSVWIDAVDNPSAEWARGVLDGTAKFDHELPGVRGM